MKQNVWAHVLYPLLMLSAALSQNNQMMSVSYTHLDVYKRQTYNNIIRGFIIMKKKIHNIIKNKNDSLCSWIIDILAYIAGGFIYAISVNSFTAPNNIAPGGASGLAIVINYLYNLPIGILTIIINIPLFIIGFFKLGKRGVLKSFIAMILSSVIIDLTVPFLPVFSGEDVYKRHVLGFFILSSAFDFIGVARPSEENSVQFTINEGDSIEDIATNLKAQDIITQPKVFELFVRLAKSDTIFSPGTYTVKTNADYN